jgi:hypothetical protein
MPELRAPSWERSTWWRACIAGLLLMAFANYYRPP